VGGQRFPVGTPVYWVHEGTYQTATVACHGRDVSGLYTEVQLEDGSTRRVHRSQLKKARIDTAARAVRVILSVPRDFPWLTMRDVIAIAADRGIELSVNAVASALANLEPSGHVEVRRDRHPYRYRGCP
jgi:hypothetical protein